MSAVNKERDICRTCLSTDGDLIPLFSYISKKSRLANKIMNISDVTMNEQDGLPEMICKKCIFLVESFDCFKKQIESANDKMTKAEHSIVADPKTSAFEMIENLRRFAEDCGDSDSDYEIQYISDEVKKRVENAFRKKRRICIINKLALLHSNFACLSAYHYGLLYALADFASGEETKLKDYRSVISSFLRSRPQENDIQMERNCDEAGNAVEVEKEETEELDEEMEPETLQSGNSECNERLVIAVEEFDDSENRREDLECTARPEENLMLKIDGMPENAENIEQRSFEPFARGSSEKGGNKILENANNVDTQSVDGNSANKKEIPEHANAKTMVETIGKLQHFFYRDKTKTLPFQKHGNGLENSVGEMHVDTEEKNLERFNVDSSDNRAANFRSGTSENSRENMSAGEFYYANEGNDMVVDDPLSIQEEVVETSKLEKQEETYEETKNFDEKNVHREALDYENVEDISGLSGIETMAKDPLQLSNSKEEPEEVGKLEIVEKAFPSEEQLLEVAKSEDGEKENAMPVKTHENFPVKKKVKNLIVDKRKAVDVIVISSDSSDEERRKKYNESGNKGISRVARRARKKVTQPVSGVRKINRVMRCPDKKMSLENEKILTAVEANKKLQTRKYFHCTSCNINLYSVSAVLHHHNKIHTPAEELLHCQMCDVQFASKTILQAHFDHHHETHLFRCSLCACEFVLKKNLRAHMNAHPKPKVEEPENKRPKLDQPSVKVQLPVQQNSINPTNDKPDLLPIQNTENEDNSSHEKREG